ncbi:MAG: N-acetylglucosamine-6-phosphate deacetylase [Clostridia bacterium]|nr:N-acetylglucosamine-6-phosphate deacetylase [Clostridia bacterium]MBO7157380.1 N-acetylglucosamine-6-phosphate deacetylase [Clostridia bacterium]MBQ5791333.1 N-acetylglucosamine-6-phosphate deacetylase [Clostridia bacterium]
MKAIVNGKLILKDRIVEGKALLYTDVIEGIVDADKVPADAEIIDAAGKYVAPGLIDLHIHGYLGKDVCDGSVESMKTICEGIVKNGVTGFLPTTMTVSMDVIIKALETCRSLMEESKTWNGTTILGVHAEGPFINTKKKGAQNPEYILVPSAEFVKEYADVIRIISLAPEMDENFKEITKMRKETDVVVSMGHTDADYDTAMASTNVGVRHATHLFNAMSPLAHRNPGVVGAALNSDVTVELIVDTFHVNPALYNMVYKLKGDKLCFITDCLPAGGLPEGEYTLGGQKFVSKGIECRLPDGTIAGSILALNKGVWNVFTNSDIPLYECVNCASLNPANAIGIGDKKGSLEVGKDADIIITDCEFNVEKTIIGGTVRYGA